MPRSKLTVVPPGDAAPSTSVEEDLISSAGKCAALAEKLPPRQAEVYRRLARSLDSLAGRPHLTLVHDEGEALRDAIRDARHS